MEFKLMVWLRDVVCSCVSSSAGSFLFAAVMEPTIWRYINETCSVEVTQKHKWNRAEVIVQGMATQPTLYAALETALPFTLAAVSLSLLVSVAVWDFFFWVSAAPSATRHWSKWSCLAALFVFASQQAAETSVTSDAVVMCTWLCY